MKTIRVDVGGRTGIDCGGFCKFCFYKTVDFKNSKPSGCINCPPGKIGCDYCRMFIDRVFTPFKPLSQVLFEFNEGFNRIKFFSSDFEDIQIMVSGGGDVMHYPHIYELISKLKESQLSLHLGYTGGKAIKNASMARDLISLGVDVVGFSVFSTNTLMRRKWMNDENAEESIKGLKIFCENIHLNASAVVIPGINDEKQIFETCIDLENWGAKSLHLRRFANFKDQGLILNNKPILEGVKPHSYEEFQDIVKKVADEFSFNVFGFPFFDPKNDIPFIVSRKENKAHLDKLTEIKSEATIITSKLAFPYLKKIFEMIDEDNLVKIVAVEKEIADLITHEDLESIDMDELQGKVIIPSGALVQDRKCESILSKDGNRRRIIRGPYVLSSNYDGEVVNVDQEEMINFELNSFNALIEKINS
ncbi:MAG: methyl coenzyme M reductase-arginine methyltransferase Mmp10 [Methanobacterium sp.]